ncbi:MAG: T9SS type A sorting domain-containing protein, partial [Bacteroidales bacterium]|nr:T9SS type A sorting domain-containing protein [Bacteroidales bacterium]
NEDGINIIWVLDEESYIIGEYYTENGDGVWGDAQTANPQGGLDDIIFIDLSELSVDEDVDTTVDVQIWNTKDEIIIENRDNARYSMMVYNILGQPMMITEIQSNSTERFSHNFAAGLYIVTMQNNENKVSAKIIVR